MNKLVLLVEDNEDDIFIMQNAFKKAGIVNPMFVAEDGRSALDYLEGLGKFADRAQFPFPGLVLLDLNLPRVHGLDVLKFIRANPSLRPTLVVVLTSSDQEIDIEKAYSLGANSYLTKPGSPQNLEAMVRCLAEYWLEWNSRPAASLA
jgi:CheY-like chemotaxis protein